MASLQFHKTLDSCENITMLVFIWTKPLTASILILTVFRTNFEFCQSLSIFNSNRFSFSPSE